MLYLVLVAAIAQAQAPAPAEFQPAPPGPVIEASFSRDLSRLGTVHDRWTAWVWDLASGRGRSLALPSMGARGIGLSSDGKVIAVWGQGVAVFGETPEPPRLIPAPEGTVYVHGALSPDGLFLGLFRETEDKKGDRVTDLCILDVKTGKELKKIRHASMYGLRLAWSRDGKRVLTLQAEGGLLIGVPGGTTTRLPELKEARDLAPDFADSVVVARGTTLVPFDLKRKAFGTPVQDRYVLLNPHVDPKSRYALSSAGDGTIRFFDLTASKALAIADPRAAAGSTDRGHTLAAVQWAVSGDEAWWVNRAGVVGTARRDSGEWKARLYVRGFQRPSRLVALAGGHVVVLGHHTLTLTPLDEPRVPWRYEQPGGFALPFDAEGSEVWFSTAEGLRVLSTATLEVSAPMPAGKVRHIHLGPDGGTVALSFADRKDVDLWNRRERKLLRTCPLPVAPGALLLNSDATRLVVTTPSTAQILLIDTATGQILKDVPGTKRPLMQPQALTPEGLLFGWTEFKTKDGLPSPRDQAIQEWDLAAGVLKRNVEAHGFGSISLHPSKPFILFSGPGLLPSVDPQRPVKDELVVRRRESLEVVWETPAPKGSLHTVWSLDGSELLTLTAQGTLVRTAFTPK